MPTFLFLDAAGKMIYKGEGYQDAGAFLTFLKAANDPLNNYSSRIARYKIGQIKDQDLLPLALQARQYHEDSLAFQIARIYKKTVIDQQKPPTLLSPKLLDYFIYFGNLINVNDPIAKYMYRNIEESDKLLQHKGYSKQLIEYLIAKDVLNPELLKNGKIITDSLDWEGLEEKVKESCDTKTAQRLVIGYKVEWYRSKQDWTNYVKASIQKQEINGIDTSGMGKAGLNNLVYYVILKYSNDPVDLKKGLDYMQIALKDTNDDDAKLDTYANLLYKLGYKTDALVTEGRALAIAEERKNSSSAKIYRETIQKMKSDLPVPVE
jgi:hypothetical protein